MSLADIQSEIAKLYQRQKAIDAVVHGEMDEDELYDLLMEHAIDPEDWAETVADNIEILLGQTF